MFLCLGLQVKGTLEKLNGRFDVTSAIFCYSQLTNCGSNTKLVTIIGFIHFQPVLLRLKGIRLHARFIYVKRKNCYNLFFLKIFQFKKFGIFPFRRSTANHHDSKFAGKFTRQNTYKQSLTNNRLTETKKLKRYRGSLKECRIRFRRNEAPLKLLAPLKEPDMNIYCNGLYHVYYCQDIENV